MSLLNTYTSDVADCQISLDLRPLNEASYIDGPSVEMHDVVGLDLYQGNMWLIDLLVNAIGKPDVGGATAVAQKA